MKLKSIIACGLLLLGVGAATTSCEDMFTAENSLVTTNLAPKDTLYQVMGIIQRMQKLADRTVLLGEVRADLVEVDPLHASADIQELYANEISEKNVYNKPADYYAVINNCNIYLAGVDSARQGQGTRKYFEKEICAVKCFRAWCYLELLKNYGEVPFITEPVLQSDEAEKIVASGKKANMGTILDFCINDLQKYPYMDENNILRQDYGNQSYAGIKYSEMIFPARALLAELYLWRGSYTNSQSDYINAARLYHDYFTFPDEEHGTGNYTSEWIDHEFRDWSITRGLSSSDYTVELPLDTTAYFGNVTDIRAVFNSVYSNNYYPSVVPSERLKTYSKSQDYCKYVNDGLGNITIYYGPHDANHYEEKTTEGDLRLYSNFRISSNFWESQFNSSMSSLTYSNYKYDGGGGTDVRIASIPLFRNVILYLHMAEALNRAGFPETAYAILAHGLSYYTMNDRDIISQEEFDRLCAIKSLGFSRREPKYAGSPVDSISNSSFVIWRSDVFGYIDKHTVQVGVENGFTRQGGSLVQIGIHSRGCGDTEFNEKYYLDDSLTLAGLIKYIKPVVPEEPKWGGKNNDPDSVVYKAALEAYEEAVIQYEADVITDSISRVKNLEYLASDAVRAKRQAHVRQLILDEEAIEGMFEGYRFYDILRYQMQDGLVSPGGKIVLPAYLKEKYGENTNDNMTGKNWYLPLPKR